jgi:hypothetical protein
MTITRTWIKVKCGILEPKHRARMSKRIWLYLYMLDLADWEEGTIKNWKDAYHAKRFGMETRTLQEWRRKLEDDGYIICIKHQTTQTIIIQNYTNPREYSGEVYNQDGVTQIGKSEVEPYSKHVMPTSKTHLKIKQTELSELRAHFSKVSGVELPCWDELDEGEKKAMGAAWTRPLKLYWKLSGKNVERTKETITKAVKGAGFDIYSPRSIQNIFSSYLRKDTHRGYTPA